MIIQSLQQLQLENEKYRQELVSAQIARSASDKPNKASRRTSYQEKNPYVAIARKFSIMNTSWLPLQAFDFRTRPDIDTSSPDRFESDNARLKALAAELHDAIPGDLRRDFFQDSRKFEEVQYATCCRPSCSQIYCQFRSQLQTMRSTAIASCKSKISIIFAPNLSEVALAALTRFEHTHPDILFLAQGKSGRYDHKFCPIIFAAGKYPNPDHAFMNETLLRVSSRLSASTFQG